MCQPFLIQPASLGALNCIFIHLQFFLIKIDNSTYTTTLIIINYYISILCEINYIHYNYTITTQNYTKTTFYLHNTYM